MVIEGETESNLDGSGRLFLAVVRHEIGLLADEVQASVVVQLVAATEADLEQTGFDPTVTQFITERFD